MNENDDRGPWYLLTGLILGVVIGLLYAWTVKPVRYTDTGPASLRKDFKDQYRALIAAAYLGNADLERARARLDLLQDGDMYRALTEQAQRTLAENGSDRQAQALGLLAIALGQAPPGPAQVVTNPGSAAPPASPTRSYIVPSSAASPVASAAASAASIQTTGTPFAVPAATQDPAALTLSALSSAAPSGLGTPGTEAPATPLSATVTPVTPPAASPTPSISAPTPTSNSPFVLLSQEKICDTVLDVPEFRIEAFDRFNQPMAGVLVIVTWPGGEDQFYTGLKPEKGPGYADYTPNPGVLYAIKIDENGSTVGNLAAVMCPQSGAAPTWGALLLKFVQP